jgi:hypothetical protein
MFHFCKLTISFGGVVVDALVFIISEFYLLFGAPYCVATLLKEENRANGSTMVTVQSPDQSLEAFCVATEPKNERCSTN